MASAFLLLNIYIFLALAGCQPQNHLAKAEIFSEERKYEEAIVEYESHIKDRMEEKRKEWENPYFYQLRISSLLLKMNNSEEALKRLKLAQENGVEKELILDGIREIAEYLSKNNKLNEAVELLDSYRELDSDYVDGIIDKLGKESLTKN